MTSGPTPEVREAWRLWAERKVANAHRIGDLSVPGFMLSLLRYIDRLEEEIEPGKASGIIHAMWDEAEKRGHNPASARHALTFLLEELDSARAALAYQATLTDEVVFQARDIEQEAARDPRD